MDEKERQAAALKKFSLISPVLNGLETNAADYFRRLSAEPVQMPGSGMRRYSEKTFSSWLSDIYFQYFDRKIAFFQRLEGCLPLFNCRRPEKVCTPNIKLS